MTDFMKLSEMLNQHNNGNNILSLPEVEHIIESINSDEKNIMLESDRLQSEILKLQKFVADCIKYDTVCQEESKLIDVLENELDDRKIKNFKARLEILQMEELELQDSFKNLTFYMVKNYGLKEKNVNYQAVEIQISELTRALIEEQNKLKNIIELNTSFNEILRN